MNHRLGYLVLLLLSGFLVGCGGGGSDGGGGGTASTGSGLFSTGTLRFSFTRAQTNQVPTATQQLKFEFFNAQNQLLSTTTQPFSTQVTITNLSVQIARVKITALDGNGFTAAVIESAVTVLGGTAVDVSLAGAANTTVTLQRLEVPGPIILQQVQDSGTQPTASPTVVTGILSNGDRITIPSSLAQVTIRNQAVATVNNALPLLPSAVNPGSTIIDVSATVGGVNQTLEVPVRVIRLAAVPATFNVPFGDTFRPQFNFTGSDGTVLNDLANSAAANVSFALEVTPPATTTGLTLATNGEIQVAGSVAAGTQFKVSATYSDPVTSTAITGVSTGTVTTPTIGNLRFQFIRAQAATVPTATTQLKFDFFNAQNQMLFTTTQPFATQVTLNNLSVDITRVKITGLEVNGLPVVEIQSAVVVLGGVTSDVNLAGATVVAVTLQSLPSITLTDRIVIDQGNQVLFVAIPVTGQFSNGQVLEIPGQFTQVSSRDLTIATVSNMSPFITMPLNPGATIIDVSATVGGVTKVAEFPLRVIKLEVVPRTFDIRAGNALRPQFNFTGTDGTVINDLANNAGAGTFNLSLQVAPPGTTNGLTLGTDGTIQVGAAVTPGTVFGVGGSYDDPVTGINIAGISRGTVIP